MSYRIECCCFFCMEWCIQYFIDKFIIQWDGVRKTCLNMKERDRESERLICFREIVWQYLLEVSSNSLFARRHITVANLGLTSFFLPRIFKGNASGSFILSLRLVNDSLLSLRWSGWLVC